MAVVALLAVLFAFGLLPLAREHSRRIRQREYDRASGGMTRALFALEDQVPRSVNPPRWKTAVRMTVTAQLDAFHSGDPPPIEELYRLREELMPKLRGSVDDQTLVWNVGPSRADRRRRQAHHRQTLA
jgi:hypothetical protein